MSPPATPLRQRLRDRARALGFENLGFAAAGRSADADRLQEWLAAGREAGMAYMRPDPERRVDPRRVLPGCRTVVVGTLGYFTPDAPRRAELPAEIARYARGRDYHRVLERMLKGLCAAITEEVGADTTGAEPPRHRWYVDTGPVLERAWAAEAGVGFVGKNACLIDPRRGSWTNLGVVLTTADLPPDPPVRVGCGTCSRCIPACPTGAIVAPGVVDSALCISYWTIEHRGSIPDEMRPLLGTRVFGCDDCQAVCPWNRFAQPASVADVRPREAFVDADLAQLSALDRDAWDRLTQGTAVRRAGYAGLLRNVAIALGNSGDPRARPHLERLAQHDEPLVREHAAWALARLGVMPSPFGAGEGAGRLPRMRARSSRGGVELPVQRGVVVPGRELAGPDGWADVFGRRAPLVVEIGFGKDPFLLEAAAVAPEHDHVGVEHDPNRASAFALEVERRGLRNVAVLPVSAELALGSCFADGSVRELHVYFPDPWPKKRHGSHRLVQPWFAREVRRVLADDGVLRIATDDAAYAAQIAETLEAGGLLRGATGAAAVPETKFGRLWQSRGRTIHAMEFRVAAIESAGTRTA